MLALLHKAAESANERSRVSPWHSHASFLFSCVMLSKERTSLRPRPITFVSVPYVGVGGCALTVKSNRRFFRRKGLNGDAREESDSSLPRIGYTPAPGFLSSTAFSR